MTESSLEDTILGKKGVWIKNIVLLQAVVVIYTLSSVMSKFAAANVEDMTKFVLFFGLEFALLGIYAVLWQQMIKRFELSVAYANRAMALVWSMIWAVIFFHDEISIQNICGVLLVILGILIINTEHKGETKENE